MLESGDATPCQSCRVHLCVYTASCRGQDLLLSGSFTVASPCIHVEHKHLHLLNRDAPGEKKSNQDFAVDVWLITRPLMSFNLILYCYKIFRRKDTAEDTLVLKYGDTLLPLIIQTIGRL
jgi:hypothetical protein